MVTGADGFIGSHLVERLVLEGARVRAFCFYNSRGSLGWLDETVPEVRSLLDVRLGDVRDARFVSHAMADVEVVLHLAALVAIPYSYVAAASFIDTNVTGTLNVLEAARLVGVRRVVHASTSEVYGTPSTLPITEEHPFRAQSPYAASKVAADQLASAFYASYDLPVTILRPFNTYGPRQSVRAVVPTMLRQLLAGQTQVRLGRLNPRRDMTFVTDTVDAFVRAATTSGIDGVTIQLGTGRSDSIAELFKIACELLNVAAIPIEDSARIRPDRSEVMVLQSDPARASALLGWAAETSLEDGLSRTIEWLRQHDEPGDAARVQL
jgi:NAD dependent epimerase/dehydratase